jgi:hypothetical protein
MAEEVALISIGRVQTSDVKQYAELVIDFSDNRRMYATSPTPMTPSLGYLNRADSGTTIGDFGKYDPNSNVSNHNAFILAKEVNEVKVGGNYLYSETNAGENKFFATTVANKKLINAYVSTTSIDGTNNYGMIVRLNNYNVGDAILFRFCDTLLTIDGNAVTEREVVIPAKSEYRIVGTREYFPVKLLSVSVYKQLKITNENTIDFSIEDQIATTDSALEFGLYIATAKITAPIIPSVVEYLMGRDASVVIRDGEYDNNISQKYSFYVSDVEDQTYNRFALTLENRVKQMQEEYLPSFGPAEERTIKELLDYALGIGTYDIVDDDKGSIESHIKNTVVKQVFSEAKSKYDFLLELCQIGLFNISFDTRFKIWRVF